MEVTDNLKRRLQSLVFSDDFKIFESMIQDDLSKMDVRLRHQKDEFLQWEQGKAQYAEALLKTINKIRSEK